MVEEIKPSEKVSLKDVIKIKYFSPENAIFTENDGFISLKTIIEDESGEKKETEYERVALHRVFPFESPDEFISVLDKDKNEVGMIRKLSDFDEQTVAMLVRELNRKYFVYYIERIISVNEKYGYFYFRVIANGEAREFTLQDAYRSIIKITQDRVYAVDVDGNRYEIKSLAALDTKSYKKIELYL